MTTKNPHWGSTLDSFLEGERVREARRAEATEDVADRQLTQEMKRQGIPNANLDTLMADIDKGLSDVAAGRVKGFDSARIIERGRKRLP